MADPCRHVFGGPGTPNDQFLMDGNGDVQPFPMHACTGLVHHPIGLSVLGFLVGQIFSRQRTKHRWAVMGLSVAEKRRFLE